MSSQPPRANDPHEAVRSEPESVRETHAKPPVMAAGYTYRSITEQITSKVFRRTPLPWYAAMGLLFLIFMVMMYSIGYVLFSGVGIWGINIPVAWGFAILNFVWWVGIGHAGTLISVILLLMYQSWRTSTNRIAEVMTIFAISQAAMFPILHLGRPWLFYWLIPYPSTMGVWPQFRSPLVWDNFAVISYFVVSVIFWYTGLIPDLATMRDRSKHRILRVLYGVFALGWRGSIKHWRNHQMTYLILAGLATPLVVSVHSVISLDFATALLPGWHMTMFPPYFVASAILSGFAMLITLMVPIRSFYGLKGLITIRHIDNMGKWMLMLALIVDYSYASELFFAWYSQDVFEQFLEISRMFGAWWWIWWAGMLCNVVMPQTLWFKRVRTNPMAMFLIAMFLDIGVWVDHYFIIFVGQSRGFLPSSWGQFAGNVWDWTTFLGTIGFFAMLIFLFLRVIPMVSMSESKELMTEDEISAGTHA